jgi:hypothetical protein
MFPSFFPSSCASFSSSADLYMSPAERSLTTWKGILLSGPPYSFQLKNKKAKVLCHVTNGDLAGRACHLSLMANKW